MELTKAEARKFDFHSLEDILEDDENDI
jgi:hypothetical protein